MVKSYFSKIIITVILQIIIIILILCVYLFNIAGFKNFISLLYQRQILQEALSNIQSFLEMCVGIYIAIISILSTGKTSITEKLSRKQKHIPFITDISIGFFECILSIVIISFAKTKNSPEILLVFSTLLVGISIYEISKFFITILMMFSYTVSNAANEAEEEQKKYDRIIKIHNNILRCIKKSYYSKSSDENIEE